MDCKDEQNENALPPMLVTESGMVTKCKDSQRQNALSPMLVTESGMVTDCKDLQFENALCNSKTHRGQYSSRSRGW